MKIRFSFTLMILTFAALVFAVDTAAARSGKWGLPEGTRLRIGKGSISNGGNVIEYSPDGTRIALASSIGIWIYDARTYQEIALLDGHSGVVLSIAYSPNGNMLVSGGEDGTVRFWDTTSGRLLRTIKPEVEIEGGDPKITTLAFSPDGDTIAHSTYTDIHLRSAATGQLLKTLRGPRRKERYRVTCLAFSPDGSTIASGDQFVLSGNLYLWAVATGKLLREINEQQLEGIDVELMGMLDVAFSPDGSTIAATTMYGFGGSQIFLIPASPDKPLTKFEQSGAARPTFSPDGTTIAIRPTGMVNLRAKIDGEVALMSASTGEVLKVLTGIRYNGIEITTKEGGITIFKGISAAHPGDMSDIAFSPDGSTIAAAGNGDFIVWSASTGELLKEITGYTVEPKGNFAFSPDGTTLAFAKDGVVELWSVATGKLLGKFIGVPTEVQRISFTPDGEKIVAVQSSASGSRFCLLDIEKSFALMRMRPTLIGFYTDLNKEFLVFDMSIKSLCYRIEDVLIIDRDAAAVDDFAFVPGEDKIIAVIDPKDRIPETQMQTWSVTTGELISTINISNENFQNSSWLSPDGSVILAEVSAGGKRTDQWFSVATGEPLKTINIKFARDPVFSPDGSVIAARVVVDGKRVLQWFSVATGELLKTINIKFAGDPVFSPDGSVIVVKNIVGDKSVLQWFSVATGELLKTINVDFVGDPVFSPDGSTIATQADDGIILLWGTR